MTGNAEAISACFMPTNNTTNNKYFNSMEAVGIGLGEDLLFAGDHRGMRAFIPEAQAAFANSDTSTVAIKDQKHLEPMAEEYLEHRVFGKRFSNTEGILNILSHDDPNKMVSFYMTTSAKSGGLKDANAPLSFSNLKHANNVLEMDRDFFGLTPNQTHSKEIEKWTDIAVKSQNPELAALLLKGAKGIMGIGTDDKVIKAIFVDSKESMGDVMHQKFMADTAVAYKESTGESLDDLIKGQYSKIGAGIKAFGADKQGNKYLAVLDESRLGTDVANPMLAAGYSGIAYS